MIEGVANLEPDDHRPGATDAWDVNAVQADLRKNCAVHGLKVDKCIGLAWEDPEALYASKYAETVLHGSAVWLQRDIPKPQMPRGIGREIPMCSSRRQVISDTGGPPRFVFLGERRHTDDSYANRTTPLHTAPASFPSGTNALTAMIFHKTNQRGVDLLSIQKLKGRYLTDSGGGGSDMLASQPRNAAAGHAAQRSEIVAGLTRLMAQRDGRNFTMSFLFAVRDGTDLPWRAEAAAAASAVA